MEHTSTNAGDWRSIRIDQRVHTVTLPEGMRIDLGGIAKGWAADLAARRLAATGPALIDAGGDVSVSGPMADGSPWPIAIASPFAPEETLGLLLLVQGAVATSGRDYRRWVQGGVEQHHIIDPRTAKPAQTDVLSATVVAPDGPSAEMAAKTALILGSQAGLAWLDARSILAGLLVLADGRVLRSRRIGAYMGIYNFACWRCGAAKHTIDKRARAMKTLQTPELAAPQKRLALPPKQLPDLADDLMINVIPPIVGALAGLVILIAIGVALAGQAGGVAALITALAGEHSAWYLSRASAFVAYVLLWWSMILGLSITNRLARLWPGGPAAADLHEHASWLGLGFALLHAQLSAAVGWAWANRTVCDGAHNAELLWAPLDRGAHLAGHSLSELWPVCACSAAWALQRHR